MLVSDRIQSLAEAERISSVCPNGLNVLFRSVLEVRVNCCHESLTEKKSFPFVSLLRHFTQYECQQRIQYVSPACERR